MRFRTEIGPIKGSFGISHDQNIVLLGSCFADNIGERLVADGFRAIHNPLGPLFNPASIARIISRKGLPYGPRDFVKADDGSWHCLDFAMRYQAESPEALTEKVNSDFIPFARNITDADIIIITFGTNKIFQYSGDIIAGNCHKIPQDFFTTRYLGIEEIVETWRDLFAGTDKRLIFTLSPVLYTESGIQANSLSKAILRVAVDEICRLFGADYFPAFEILNDDLRDYRFYADDLKHPSPMAVQYIYEHFAGTYFSKETKAKAIEEHSAYLRRLHRPIL